MNSVPQKYQAVRPTKKYSLSKQNRQGVLFYQKDDSSYLQYFSINWSTTSSPNSLALAKLAQASLVLF